MILNSDEVGMMWWTLIFGGGILLVAWVCRLVLDHLSRGVDFNRDDTGGDIL